MRKYLKVNLDGEHISKIRYQNDEDEFTGYAYKEMVNFKLPLLTATIISFSEL